MSTKTYREAQEKIAAERRAQKIEESRSQMPDRAGLDSWFEEWRREAEAIEAAKTPEQREAERLERLEFERAEQERRERETAEANRRHLVHRIESSGLRLAAGDAERIASGDYEQTAAVQRVASWWAETGPGAILCLIGGTGIGKTFAAATLAHRAGIRGVRSNRLAKLCSSGWSEHAAEFEELLKFRGVLVVDDVGAERNADDARAALFELLDERQGAHGRTVLTSNLSLSGDGGLKDRMCERSLSRLRGCGAIFSVKGSDMRGSK